MGLGDGTHDSADPIIITVQSYGQKAIFSYICHGQAEREINAHKGRKKKPHKEERLWLRETEQTERDLQSHKHKETDLIFFLQRDTLVLF